MTSHRRMIDNLCRQALDEGQAVTHREDLLAAEVRRLQAEVEQVRSRFADEDRVREQIWQVLTLACGDTPEWLDVAADRVYDEVIR